MHSRTSLTKQLLGRCLGVVSNLEHCPSVAQSKSVLLTFDDGPDPTVTPQILDLLDQHNTRAVFFIAASRIEKAPELLRETLARGHVLGNHTWTHWLKNPPGYRLYKADLARAQADIERHSGATPTLFRPALGQITAASLLAARRLQLTYMRWSVDSGDWQMREDRAASERGHCLAGEVTENDIVLMHDYNPHTPALLGRFLETLAANTAKGNGPALNPAAVPQTPLQPAVVRGL